MNGTFKLAMPLLAALAIAACDASGVSALTGTSAQSASPSRQHAIPQLQACAPITRKPTCSLLIEAKSGTSGWGPADFQAAYNLPSKTQGKGQIVAVVNAYDNPNITTDLATYRAKYGLAKGKFFKYSEEGFQEHYPFPNKLWAPAIDVDVEMVAAACPLCTIDLVEANSNGKTDLENSVATAVKLGAHIVMAGWICAGLNTCDDPSAFEQPGVVYLAPAGDQGYDQNGAPESFGSVVSVGGTVLTKSGSTYSEAVWASSGGGCSNNGSGQGVTKPSWQHDPDCSYRTDDDVSAVAVDVAAYFGYGNFLGWFETEGTGISASLTAGIFALAGNAKSQHAPEKFWTLTGKQLTEEMHDISTGSDGSCGGSYLCTAGTKQYKTYSGPGGWGTPNGVAAY